MLSDFSFTPHSVILGDDAGHSEVGDAIKFPLTVRVKATDEDADIETVSYIVQSPVSGREPIASGELTSKGGQIYERTVDVTIPKAEVGVYTVLLYAVDKSGSLSNNVRGMLQFKGTGEPPVIADVSAPDSVSRPPAGNPPTPIRIVATVTDPDGLANISGVQFWNVVNPAQKFPMFDDGETGGDQVRGDGRYTITVQIESTNQAGTNRLGFQATDLAGLKSNVVERAIVVE